MAHECFRPFIALGSTTDASKFALRIIEMPIIRDYLSKTNGVPLQGLNHVPDDQDWWDTVDKESYARVLALRHKGKPSFVEVMGTRVQWPDISTFNGPTVRIFRGGAILRQPMDRSPRQGRSEIYEIKPDNKTGEADALLKLRNIEASYVTFGISNIYERGTAYPLIGTARIRLEPAYEEAFLYLVNYYLRQMGVVVDALWIEVRRSEPGVLLYKFCVDLGGAEYLKRDNQVSLAWFVARTLLKVENQYQPIAVQQSVAAYAEALTPEDPALEPRRLQPIVAGRDLRKLPYLTIKSRSMADELIPQLPAIRDGMYSRLLGAPGDRYLLCCDDAWYQSNVILPGKAKVARQIDTIKFDLSFPVTNRGGFINVGIPLVFKSDAAMEAVPWAGAVYRTLKDPQAVLIIASCCVVLTASVISIVLTAGADAPVAGAAAAGALGTIEATVAGASTVSAVGGIVGTESTVIGAGTVGLSGSVMSTVAAADVTAVSTTPVALATASRVATVEALELVSWARQAAQVGSTAGELAEARALNVATKILVDAMKSKAMQIAVTGAAVAAASLTPKVAHAQSSTSPSSTAKPAESLPSGTPLAIGLSSTTAQALRNPPAPGETLKPENLAEPLHQEVGHLYLVRVPRKGLPTQISEEPPLYQKVNVVDYAEPLVWPTPSYKGSRLLVMLGCIEVI